MRTGTARYERLFLPGAPWVRPKVRPRGAVRVLVTGATSTGGAELSRALAALLDVSPIPETAAFAYRRGFPLGPGVDMATQHYLADLHHDWQHRREAEGFVTPRGTPDVLAFGRYAARRSTRSTDQRTFDYLERRTRASALGEIRRCALPSSRRTQAGTALERHGPRVRS